MTLPAIMRALTWQGTRRVAVEDVPDPAIIEPTDAIIRVTSTAICGSDLHLYDVLGPFLDRGDVLGHEPMGVVEEVGADVVTLRPGDRVVVPFVIACGDCFFCAQQQYAACETTNPDHGSLLMQRKQITPPAALFGYSHLYGGVPGGQAELVRTAFSALKAGRARAALDHRQQVRCMYHLDSSGSLGFGMPAC